MGGKDVFIRMAKEEDWDNAMELAWKTFLKFEANDYSEKGIRSFEEFITDSTLHRMFILGKYQMLVAEMNHKMIGMITLRDESHISLLFVDADYHKKGVGRNLIEALKKYLKTELGIFHLTVNAAPYGIGFYHKLGFYDLDLPKENDGIIYTPMELKFY